MKIFGRRFTNIIRFVMDELLPPIIRNNRYFMFPFFYFAYGGKNIRQTMEFKRNVYTMSEKQYVDFYASLDSISRNRLTDLSEANITYILNRLYPNAKSLIDVGCGKGYFLDRLKNKDLILHGCDIVDKSPSKNFIYHSAPLHQLPFKDGEFDIVVCSHTLEHVLKLREASGELERITKNQLIVVVPCQQYFYYTLDEHVNFFDFKERITSLFSFKKHQCLKVAGDWIYIGYR